MTDRDTVYQYTQLRETPCFSLTFQVDQVEMLLLSLLVPLGLAMADTDPRDFARLCDSGGECPSLLEQEANCSVEGEACDVGKKNLLTSYAGVETVRECEALCADNLDCEFITHFGPDSFPFRNYCMLFSECGRLTECQDCTTSTTSEELCFPPFCSSKLEGPLKENVLEIIPGVEDERSCKAACRNQSECKAYTYYDNSDLVLFPCVFGRTP